MQSRPICKPISPILLCNFAQIGKQFRPFCSALLFLIDYNMPFTVRLINWKRNMNIMIIDCEDMFEMLF